MVTIRFKDFRSNLPITDYGKIVYVTKSLDDARRFMDEHDNEMRFIAGGGIRKDGRWTEIYWDIVIK